MFGCCAPNELAYQLGEFTVDAQDCSERLLDTLAAGVADPWIVGTGVYAEPPDGVVATLVALAGSVAKARVAVDTQALNACAAATRERACTPQTDRDVLGRCAPHTASSEAMLCNPSVMFEGRQREDETCDQVWECAAGLRCIIDGDGGTCVVRSGDGQTCFEDLDCAHGLVCDWTTGTCVEGAGHGESCTYWEPSMPVPGTEVFPCAEGLWCDSASETCTSDRCTLGATCRDRGESTDCPESTFCAITISSVSTCRFPAENGEYCVFNSTCASGYCESWHHACAAGTAVNTRCTEDESCASGWCVDGRCSATVAHGESCPTGEHEECVSGYCSSDDPAGPTCRPYAREGESCSIEGACDPAQDLACVDGTCQGPPWPNGSPCSDPTNCASQVCYASVCSRGRAVGEDCSTEMNAEPCTKGAMCDPTGTTRGVCAHVRPPGAACEHDNQCWGFCVVRFGRRMCDWRPAESFGEAWCDGVE